MSESRADAARLRERYVSVRARLLADGAREARDTIKAEIIALYHEVEQEVARLAELKEDIKGLAERWKTLGQSAIAAQPPGAQSQVLRVDHIGASTYTERGWSSISLGDYEGAEQALTRALELSPGDPHTESLLGWAEMLQDKLDEALVRFQRVLTREPGNALARVNLGYICLKKRIFGEAIEHLSKAIRLDNDRKATLYAHFYLGLVYMQRELYEDAESFFRRTIALGPNLIEAYYELGRALWFAGRRDAACEAWRAGARANKFNPWGKRCAEMVGHVEGGGEPPRGL